MPLAHSLRSTNHSQRIFLAFFVLLSLLNLIAEFLNIEQLILATKPLLMLTLIGYTYTAAHRPISPFLKLILIGFIFAMAGDTFLMFNENQLGGDHYFLLGLGSFLLTHICYALAFIRYQPEKKGLLQIYPWLLIPFILFLIGNMTMLWPDIPEPLRYPVLVYSLAIVAMAATCLHLYTKIPMSAFRWLMAGVVFFMLSDNIIALNKFKITQLSIPYPRLCIMIPYLLGQWMIAEGSLRIPSIK